MYGEGQILFKGPLTTADGDVPTCQFPAKNRDGTPYRWGDLLCTTERGYVNRVSVGWGDDPLGVSSQPASFSLRAAVYKGTSVDAATLDHARARLASFTSGGYDTQYERCVYRDPELVKNLEVDDHGSGIVYYKPSEIPRVLSDWQPVDVLESASATPDSEGGFGVGLNAQCPLYSGLEGEGPYSDCLLDVCRGEGNFEARCLYMSGIHYSMRLDAPPGPFSEFFELLVHVYFKPFGADGQTHWWLEDGIDHLRDELLPPLRPFAIKISLVPRDEYGDQDEATVRAYLAGILK